MLLAVKNDLKHKGLPKESIRVGGVILCHLTLDNLTFNPASSIGKKVGSKLMSKFFVNINL